MHGLFHCASTRWFPTSSTALRRWPRPSQVVGGTEESPHGLSLRLRLRCSWGAEESKGGSAGCLDGVYLGWDSQPQNGGIWRLFFFFEPTNEYIWIYLGSIWDELWWLIVATKWLTLGELFELSNCASHMCSSARGLNNSQLFFWQRWWVGLEPPNSMLPIVPHKAMEKDSKIRNL